MNMQDSSNKQQVIVAVVMLLIGFTIGVLITAGWYQKGEMSPVDTATTTEEQINEDDNTSTEDNGSDDELSDRSNNNSITSSGAASLSAENQVAGDTVTVSEVVAPEVTWVAVREQRDNGMGNILGAKRVEAGTHQGVSVKLLRATESGQTYYVTLYQDNGDGEFSHLTDTIIESDGSTVFTTFEASAE